MAANKNNFLIYITEKNIDFWRKKIRKAGTMGGFVNWAIEKHGQEYIDNHLKELSEK